MSSINIPSFSLPIPNFVSNVPLLLLFTIALGLFVYKAISFIVFIVLILAIFFILYNNKMIEFYSNYSNRDK
jgi:hypothetical protein